MEFSSFAYRKEELQEFLKKFNDPQQIVDTSSKDLLAMLIPHQITKEQVYKIKSFCRGFLEQDWEYPISLPGVGSFADDCYRIFCCYQFDITTTYPILQDYLAWIRPLLPNSFSPEYFERVEPSKPTTSSDVREI
jgi:hypothetical protein